jgi:hypothetical protein
MGKHVIVTPNTLPRFFVVPQALDNQWFPLGMLDDMISKQRPYEDVVKKRDQRARDEYIRALINAPLVILNRAFFYNSSAVSCDYRTPGSQEYADFQKLLNTRVLSPFLFAEKDPGEEARNYDVLDDFSAWQSLCNDPGTAMKCVRLSRDEAENRRLISERLARPFHEFIQSMNSPVAVEYWRRAFNLAPREQAGFRQRLTEMAMFAAQTAGQEKYLTRQQVYERYLVKDGCNVAKPVFARHSKKPWGMQLKRLIDLRYACNLPDALGGFPLTPVDSDDRTLLAELGRAQSRGKVQAKHLADLICQEVFARLQTLLYVPLLSRLALGDVLAVRQTTEWKQYIKSARELIKSAGQLQLRRCSTEIPTVFKAYQEMANAAAGVLQKKRRGSMGAKVCKWIPIVGIVLEVGGAKLESAFPKTGLIVKSAGKLLTATADGSAKLIARLVVRGEHDAKDDQALSLNLVFLSTQLQNAKEQWEDLIKRVRCDKKLTFIDLTERVGTGASEARINECASE